MNPPSEFIKIDSPMKISTHLTIVCFSVWNKRICEWPSQRHIHLDDSKKVKHSCVYWKEIGIRWVHGSYARLNDYKMKINFLWSYVWWLKWIVWVCHAKKRESKLIEQIAELFLHGTIHRRRVRMYRRRSSRRNEFNSMESTDGEGVPMQEWGDHELTESQSKYDDRKDQIVGEDDDFYMLATQWHPPEDSV